MKGTISTKEINANGDILLFDINQENFDDKQTRLITKNKTLAGLILTTDWGIDNDREINFEIYVTEESLRVLQNIHINSTDVIFAYRNDIYNVIIISCNERPLRDKYFVQLHLTILNEIQQSE